MRELISIPGLQFQLFELHGSLTYTFTRAGRPAVQSVLSELDYVDLTRDEDSGDGMPQPKKPGLDASAVGIQVRVLKNDGQLQLDFEARDGGSAKWVFDGLSADDAKPLSVSTSTQTIPDPSLCITCGRPSVSPAGVTDSSAQTAKRVSEDAVTSTITTDSTSVRHRKRKTSVSLRAEQPPQKRTQREDESAPQPPQKRTQRQGESAPQPRNIYMSCLNRPLRKGDVDTLELDTVNGDMIFSEVYGLIGTRVERSKRVNLFVNTSKLLPGISMLCDTDTD